MGVYYYLVNHTTKQIAGHFGKRGEFDEEEEALKLNWNIETDYIDSVSEHDVYDYEYETLSSPKAHNDDNIYFRVVYNFTKKQYYENNNYEIKLLTPSIKENIRSKCNWSAADKLIFKTYASYYHPGFTNEEFTEFFYSNYDNEYTKFEI